MITSRQAAHLTSTSKSVYSLKLQYDYTKSISDAIQEAARRGRSSTNLIFYNVDRDKLMLVATELAYQGFHVSVRGEDASHPLALHIKWDTDIIVT